MEFSTLNGYKVKDKKAIRYYDTVADMKADTTLKNGMHVKTKGYYAINDGGGSEYVIKSSSTGFYETLNNELVGELIAIDKRVNILQLGAKNDKTIDIGNIINNNQSLFDEIFISEGNYLLHTAITLTSLCNIICDNNAFIFPDITDNLINIKTAFCTYKLNIDGTDQTETDNTKYAIVIGADGYNARHTNLSFSKIQNLSQSAILWEQGAFANFTNLYEFTISGYGINCTGNYNDNNHGIFTNTELIYCGIVGCLIAKGETEDVSSRHHIFENFKIFGCYKGMEIQTHSNMGSVMFEKCSPDHTTNTNCCELTADSKGNKIEIINDVNVWVNIKDYGSGNLICGYSRYGFYAFKDIRANSVKVHTEGLTGRLEFTQENSNEILDRITDSTTATTVKHGKGTASKRTDEFEANVKIDDFKFSTAKTGVVDLSGSVTANSYTSVAVASSSSWASTSPIPTIWAVLAMPSGFDTTKDIRLVWFMTGTAITFKIFNNTSSDIDLTGAKIRWTCINHY